MKKITLFLLAITATLAAGVGAQALADRCDPTARGNNKTEALAAAEACTLPCASCDYFEV